MSTPDTAIQDRLPRYASNDADKPDEPFVPGRDPCFTIAMLRHERMLDVRADRPMWVEPPAFNRAGWVSSEWQLTHPGIVEFYSSKESAWASKGGRMQ